MADVNSEILDQAEPKKENKNSYVQQHAICRCKKRIRIGRNKRASGLQYKNTPERLQELREKPNR